MKNREKHTVTAVGILEWIRLHTKDNILRTETICQTLGLKTRSLTEFIGELRDAGQWICGSQSIDGGYYYARNRFELEEYLQKEERCLAVQHERIKRMRNFRPPGLNLFDEIDPKSPEGKAA